MDNMIKGEEMFTTIRISKEANKVLETKKIHPNQAMSEIIDQMLGLSVSKDNTPKSDDALKVGSTTPILFDHSSNEPTDYNQKEKKGETE